MKWSNENSLLLFLCIKIDFQTNNFHRAIFFFHRVTITKQLMPLIFYRNSNGT